jgi:hypothetical protein
MKLDQDTTQNCHARRTFSFSGETREAHMAAKADFSADEWKLLLQSPLVAGVAISAADPSGLIGMMRG